AAELSQDNGHQIARVEMIRVHAQRGPEMIECGLPIASLYIQLRQCQICGGVPSLAPSRLIERGIGFFVATQIPQCETEVVIRLSVVWVGVTADEPVDCNAEMPFGVLKLASTQVPSCHGIVAAAIARITAQSLAPVRFGVPRGVAVLLKVKADYKKLVVA